MEENKKTTKVNLIAVDMGYGHQRAADPLVDISLEGVINANEYKGISEWEKNVWKQQRGSYEYVSYLKKIPLLGEAIFWVMDRFQQIPSYYPVKDLRQKTLQQRFFFEKIKQGVGRDLIKQLNKNNLPIVATFPVPVYFGEHWKFKNQIYCVICDTDVSRFWAPINPKKSKTKYFASTRRAANRLVEYGVNRQNIILTGFPLPKENIGGETKPILRSDLSNRLARLDKNNSFHNKYSALIAQELPEPNKKKLNRPLKIVFAIGGAGAQAEIAIRFLKSISNDLKQKKYSLVLVAGVRENIKNIFEQEINKLNLDKDEVSILYQKTKPTYFTVFNKTIRDADMLITKPSELSFFAGLGLPIIMTEPVGAQEFSNRNWLISIGAGIDALNWDFANEWLDDMIKEDKLAKAAFMGYFEAENMGTYNIEKYLNDHH